MRAYSCVLFLILLACGSDEAPASESAESPAPPAEANAARSTETPETPTEAQETPRETPPEAAITPEAPAPNAPLIDLLQVEPRQLTASSVYRDDLTQVERLTDGDFETAWNSQTMEPGADEPVVLTFVLPENAQLQTVMLTVGYTKLNRGRDLFVQNLRIRHARIVHGAETFEADLDIDERGLQTIPVNGSGGEWRIEFTAWEPGEREDYRELCVSELRVMGRLPGSESAGEQTDAQMDAEDAAFEAEMAELDAEIAAENAEDEAALMEDDEDSPLAVVLTPRPDLHLTEMVLAPDIDRRTPVDPRSTYSKMDGERVNCFFRLQNPEREETEVFISWENEEGESRNEPTAIPVPPNRTFTHWRYTSTGWRRPGVYTCVIRNADEEVLGRAPFELTE